jgi:hypothetical protein
MITIESLEIFVTGFITVYVVPLIMALWIIGYLTRIFK